MPPDSHVTARPIAAPKPVSVGVVGEKRAAGDFGVGERPAGISTSRRRLAAALREPRRSTPLAKGRETVVCRTGTGRKVVMISSSATASSADQSAHGANSQLRDEDKIEDVLAYLKTVKTNLLASPGFHTYEQFLVMTKQLLDPTKQLLDPALDMVEVIKRISAVFCDRQELFIGFNILLPPGCSIELRKECQTGGNSTEALVSGANREAEQEERTVATIVQAPGSISMAPAAAIPHAFFSPVIGRQSAQAADSSFGAAAGLVSCEKLTPAVGVSGVPAATLLPSGAIGGGGRKGLLLSSAREQTVGSGFGGFGQPPKQGSGATGGFRSISSALFGASSSMGKLSAGSPVFGAGNSAAGFGAGSAARTRGFGAECVSFGVRSAAGVSRSEGVGVAAAAMAAVGTKEIKRTVATKGKVDAKQFPLVAVAKTKAGTLVPVAKRKSASYISDALMAATSKARAEVLRTQLEAETRPQRLAKELSAGAKPVEFDDAGKYVSQIKCRFQHDPKGRQKFLNLLQSYALGGIEPEDRLASGAPSSAISTTAAADSGNTTLMLSTTEKCANMAAAILPVDSDADGEENFLPKGWPVGMRFTDTLVFDADSSSWFPQRPKRKEKRRKSPRQRNQLEIRVIEDSNHPCYAENGRGVFATGRISKGVVLFEYSGKVRKTSRSKPDGNLFVFKLAECHNFFIDIDANETGNESRFLNDPLNVPGATKANVQFKGPPEQPLGTVQVLTLRQIEIGEELLVSYGDEYWKNLLGR